MPKVCRQNKGWLARQLSVHIVLGASLPPAKIKAIGITSLSYNISGWVGSLLDVDSH